MIKLKRFGLAFMAELAVAMVLGVNAHAQVPAPSPGATGQGGELQQITVTGYLIPRIGEGPQPVVSYDQDFLQKQANQLGRNAFRYLPNGNSTCTPRAHAD